MSLFTKYKLFTVKEIDEKKFTSFDRKAEPYIKFLNQLIDDDLEVWNRLQRQLRDSGKTEVADLIFIEMTKKGIALNSNTHGIKFYWAHLIGWLTNYGTNFYRPLLFLLLPLFFISSFMFSDPRNISPTYDAVEAYGGYDIFFGENKDPEDPLSIYNHLTVGEPLTYYTLCTSYFEHNGRHKLHTPHPICEGSWDILDGVELALTYHLPMFSYFIDPAWEARSEPLIEDSCLLSIPSEMHYAPNKDFLVKFDWTCIDFFKELTPGRYTFFASFLSWVIIPVYFYGFASRVIRRYEG